MKAGAPPMIAQDVDTTETKPGTETKPAPFSWSRTDDHGAPDAEHSFANSEITTGGAFAKTTDETEAAK